VLPLLQAEVVPPGWMGGLICLVAIFAPSFLLVAGALPFWESLRRSVHAQAALGGVNAAVVGLLLAALYQPVWTSAIQQPQDFGLALVALMFWKLPPWLVVMGGGAAGWLLSIVLCGGACLIAMRLAARSDCLNSRRLPNKKGLAPLFIVPRRVRKCHPCSRRYPGWIFRCR